MPEILPRQRIIQIDAFTSRPFHGNPAAVCPLETERDDAWMQQVAAEMNLAETAFLRRLDDGSFDLRWFTPAVEVDLCGHATLASAHWLFETGQLAASDGARFHTRSGLLTARRTAAGVELNFPATPCRPARNPNAIADTLGIPLVEVAEYGADALAVAEDAATVSSFQPNLAAIATLPVRGLTLTAPGDETEDPPWDCVSRFFGPRVGVPEDPVTGSAHCGLAPYWSERLGKNRLRAYQASERGGEIALRVEGERVFLEGQAVTVLVGELLA
ncbi:MAG: PhzF family phenazine biosynthesis protein [Acidobacteriota bacterium]